MISQLVAAEKKKSQRGAKPVGQIKAKTVTAAKMGGGHELCY